MARVTEEYVKRINYETTLTADQVTPFLRTANNLVTGVLTGYGVSSEQLADIEAWLAAAFVAATDRQVTQEKMGDASAKYGGQLGMGWEYTSYGQVAIRLDPTGILKGLGNAKGHATIEVLELVETT